MVFVTDTVIVIIIAVHKQAGTVTIYYSLTITYWVHGVIILDLLIKLFTHIKLKLN